MLKKRSYLSVHRVAVMLFFGCMLFSSCIYAQYKYTIRGKLTGGAGKMLYFSQDTYVSNTEKTRSDSILIDGNDNFKLAGQIKYAGLYSIYIEQQKAFLTFYLDTTAVAISGTADKIWSSNVAGSRDQELIAQYQKMDGPIQQLLEQQFTIAIDESKKPNKDTVLILRYKKSIDSLNAIRGKIANNFIKEHPRAYQTLGIISSYLGYEISYGTAEKQLRLLPEIFSRNPLFIKVSQLIAGHKFTQPGIKLPDIALPDTTLKNIVHIKKVLARNKYVLIDFWASWCGPCRANNPQLKEMYARYKGRKFEIAGISLDNDPGKWKEAVVKDATNWIHISDLKGWENKYALLFNVQSIPSYMLVDSAGTLILKTSKIKEIETKLDQLF